MNTQLAFDTQIGKQDRVDIRQNFTTVWDSKWLIIGTMGLFLLFGLLYNFLTEPTYSADVIIQIGHQENYQPGTGLGRDLTVYGDLSPVTAEVQILKSRLVLGSVVDQHNLLLEAEPTYFPLIGKGVARFFESRSYDESATTSFRKPLFNQNKYAWGGEQIVVDQFDVPDSSTDKFFILTALSDGQYEIKDGLGYLVLQGKVGALSSATSQDNNFSVLVSKLSARPGTQFKLRHKSRYQTIESLRQKLRILEQGEKSGIIKLELRGSDPSHIVPVLNSIADAYILHNKEHKIADVKGNLKFLEQKLPAVKADLESFETVLNEFRLDSGSVDLNLETASTLSRIVAIETELRDLGLKRRELQTRFTAQHPSIVALDAQSSLLRNDLRQLETTVYEMPETQRKILSLNRNVEVNTALYTALLTRTQELKIALASATSDASILDRATAATKPVKPKKPTTLIIAAALGGLLGLFASFLKIAMVKGVEDPTEFEEKLDLPICATIPHSKLQKKISRRRNKNANDQDIQALAHVQPKDISIECLRNLRTSLFYSINDAKNNVVLITSASPQVGKSFVSANLAILLANSGKSVALVDADMRRGSLHRTFLVPQKPGLSMALQQDLIIEEIIEETRIENLVVVATGELPSNPSELLMSNRFAALLDILSIRYDYVILDAPPVLAASDAGILSRLAGTTMLVIKSGVNPMREVEQCTKHLMQNSANLKGIIFNDINLNGKSKSYGGYVYQYTSIEA